MPDQLKNEAFNEDNGISRGGLSPFARSCFEWVEALITAAIIVVLIFTFLFRTIAVTGFSMQDTLQDKDRVIVTSLFYTPKPGDVVVITRAAHVEEPLVKRVIAVGGQTLKIDFSTGEVYVDGILQDEPYIKNKTTRPGDWNFPEVIPEGYVFVMGDNRQISKDSRNQDIGLIDERDIIGKVQCIFYPFNRIGRVEGHA
jgi:signal peptidase I